MSVWVEDLGCQTPELNAHPSLPAACPTLAAEPERWAAQLCTARSPSPSRAAPVESPGTRLLLAGCAQEPAQPQSHSQRSRCGHRAVLTQPGRAVLSRNHRLRFVGASISYFTPILPLNH